MAGFLRKPDFAVEGATWPHREASRFVAAGGLRWHVQSFGAGPDLLLLHGAGAGVHSFRDLAPLLAPRFRVTALDLPGHGFTETPVGEGLSLEGMAAALRAALRTLGVAPKVIVGHSAGAAIAVKLSLAGPLDTQGSDPGAPPTIIGVNAALEPFQGAAGYIFPVLARLLFLNPFAVRAFSTRALRPRAVERLIAQTGSQIDAAGIAAYRTLLGCPGHVAGALGMMARWNLEPLHRDLPKLKGPLLLLAGAGDAAVPARVSEAAAGRVPGARAVVLPRLGHLAHEEDPSAVAQLILEAMGEGAPS